jgi:MFS family permease
VPGLVLVGGGFFAVTWGLVRANAAGWASGEVIGTLIAGGVVIGVFVWWEQRAATPMLSLALFRRRRFNSANGVSFFMYAGLFGAAFLMAQFFQGAQHLSPLETGVRLLPWTGAPMIVSPLAGKLADRYGNRPFMTAGLILQGVGLGWVAAVAAVHVGYGALGPALGVAGLGIALVFPTVSTEVLASVPGTEVGVASGTNSALREIGGVFGVAVLASVFARPGVYTSPAIFVEGFKAALWVAAGFSAAGAVAAVLGAAPPAAPVYGVEPEPAQPALAGAVD